MRSLTKAWWLLALCGVLEAVIAIIYFIMQNASPLTFHRWHLTVMLLGRFTLAAGVCMIAAGIWRFFRSQAWLLVLNGLALTALGVIYTFFVGSRISFRTIALLIILMAISAAVPELQTARIMWRYGAAGWLLALAGALSVAFAFVFVVLGFGGLKAEPGSHQELLWLGFYFIFSAICMLGFALRPNGSRERLYL